MRSIETLRSETYIPPLSDEDREMLQVESGIHTDWIAGRGYYTATSQDQVPVAFKDYQRRLGCVMPAYSPDGTTTSFQLKPKRPRLDKKAKLIKYETPAERPLIVDVHPFNMDAVTDPSIPLWITEGIKKADSLSSRGLCAVALFGVDCWGKGGKLLPCWDHIALEGREVFVVFDSDVMVKPEVQDALRRLIPLLEERGANG